MAGGVKLLLKVGVDLTATTTLKVVGFVHPLAVSVYTYVTFTGADVVLISVSFGLPLPLPAVLDMPVTAARVQANVVPDVALVGV